MLKSSMTVAVTEDEDGRARWFVESTETGDWLAGPFDSRDEVLEAMQGDLAAFNAKSKEQSR